MDHGELVIVLVLLIATTASLALTIAGHPRGR